MCEDVITGPKEASHDMHGSSGIKGLLGDVSLSTPEKYQRWAIVNRMRTWRSQEGFNVYVSVYLSPDGKVRAYCHACESEYCIHAWEGLQGALKSIILSMLEEEYRNFIEAITIMDTLSPEDKEKILQRQGIDTEDLNDYNRELIERNKEEIKKRYGSDIRSFYP